MGTRTPKILYLASAWPHGRAYGGQLRALHIARALRQVGDVTLLVVGSEADDDESRRLSAEEFPVLPPAPAVADPNESLTRKLRAALDPRYLNIHGCGVSPADHERIASLRDQFDLVWLLNSRTPNIIGLDHWSHAHLDIDDLPSSYQRSQAAVASSVSGRWKARIRHILLRRRERRLRHRFTTLSVCSQADWQLLGGGGQVHILPNGFVRPAHKPHRCPATNPPRLGFIGLYSYPPNLEGVRWFVRDCWPRLRQEVPGIRLRLIGKDTDGPLRPEAPDVDALGWVADPSEEIATWSAMIVPVQVGGGTRVKLADAFSRKCPVVATPLGAYGYEVEDHRQLRLAATPSEFAAACLDLVRDPGAAVRLAEHAWSDFLTKWTWDVIEPRVRAAAEDCLRRSRNGLAA